MVILVSRRQNSNDGYRFPLGPNFWGFLGLVDGQIDGPTNWRKLERGGYWVKSFHLGNINSLSLSRALSTHC